MLGVSRYGEHQGWLDEVENRRKSARTRPATARKESARKDEREVLMPQRFVCVCVCVCNEKESQPQYAGTAPARKKDNRLPASYHGIKFLLFFP